MLLNYLENAYVGNTSVKKIYTGDKVIWPNEKEFSISWNFLNYTVTAYTPRENENDRPRINTFRTDGNYVIYLSAGYTIYNPTTATIGTVGPYQVGPAVWGNRISGTEIINIPLIAGLSAGIDFFTQNTLPSAFFEPSFDKWKVEQTGNQGELKYQIMFDRYSSPSTNIYIGSVPKN
jgi:hypothetical protein